MFAISECSQCGAQLGARQFLERRDRIAVFRCGRCAFETWIPSDDPNALADLLAAFAKSDAQADQQRQARRERSDQRRASMISLAGRLATIAFVTVLGGFLGGWIALASIKKASQTHGAGELAEQPMLSRTGPRRCTGGIRSYEEGHGHQRMRPA